MITESRRKFLKAGAMAALATVTLPRLTLPAFAQATENSGDAEDYRKKILSNDIVFKIPPVPKEPALKATEDNILGPYYLPGAPYRAKICPPLAPGKALLIKGRVWNLETKRPLAGAVLDVWHADDGGNYDMDTPGTPLAPGIFYCRARLVTDESGYYEYETIHPGSYAGRPSHIHYLVRAQGCESLVTQLYFKGDKLNGKDPFVKKSLIVEMAESKIGAHTLESGVFDIVLAAGAPVDLVITVVGKGSQAEAAGVRVGDIVESYNGKTMRNHFELRSLIAEAALLEKIPLVLRRGEETLAVDLKPGPIGINLEERKRK